MSSPRPISRRLYQGVPPASHHHLTSASNQDGNCVEREPHGSLPRKQNGQFFLPSNFQEKLASVHPEEDQPVNRENGHPCDERLERASEKLEYIRAQVSVK